MRCYYIYIISLTIVSWIIEERKGPKGKFALLQPMGKGLQHFYLDEFRHAFGIR